MEVGQVYFFMISSNSPRKSSIILRTLFLLSVEMFIRFSSFSFSFCCSNDKKFKSSMS